MTSKERVLTTFANQEADRVPINYSANGGIDKRLKEHFGLQANDGEGLLQAIGVDFRGVGARYTGPKLHQDVPARGVLVDNWGIHTRWIEHETGGYQDLKKTFGGRLAFHGCISTAGPVVRGTVEDTIEYCRNTLDIMMPGGGYCFAPTHSLQDNSPTDNVVAMYETAREHGKY